jgi:hypothetical protein
MAYVEVDFDIFKTGDTWVNGIYVHQGHASKEFGSNTINATITHAHCNITFSTPSSGSFFLLDFPQKF